MGRGATERSAQHRSGFLDLKRFFWNFEWSKISILEWNFGEKTWFWDESCFFLQPLAVVRQTLYYDVWLWLVRMAMGSPPFLPHRPSWPTQPKTKICDFRISKEISGFWNIFCRKEIKTRRWKSNCSSTCWERSECMVPRFCDLINRWSSGLFWQQN